VRVWDDWLVATAAASEVAAPAWFGSAARGIAFFPVMMAGYATFYAAWWPFAWGIAGTVALVAVVVLAGAFVLRGLAQIRHAADHPSEPSAEDRRLDRAMGVLNSVTHPI